MLYTFNTGLIHGLKIAKNYQLAELERVVYMIKGDGEVTELKCILIKHVVRLMHICPLTAIR